MSSEYIQFQFYKAPPSGKGWSGWEARKWVAAQLDGKKDIEALLHYKGSIPDDSYPVVRFLGGRDNFRIVGIGKKGIEAVMDAARHFHHIDSTPLQVRMTGGTVGMKPSNGRLYTTTFVPSRKMSGVKRVLESQQEGGKAAYKKWIRSRLYDGLYKQARELGLPIGDFELHVLQVETRTPAPIEVNGGKTILAPRVKVAFNIDHDLEGPWSVGSLISRGHGSISRIHPLSNRNEGENE